MNDQRDLEGLSALVTGATSGIGKEHIMISETTLTYQVYVAPH